MNAKELVQEACGILGQPVPNSIQGSSDAGVRQMLGLLNNEGRELAPRYEWEGLIQEANFLTVNTEDQGALSTIIGAANNYRYVLSDTLYNRTTSQPITGPKSSMEWQLMKTFGITGPFTEYRIRGGHLLLLSAPAAGNSVYFEYVTRNWASTADGVTGKRAVTLDTDILRLDDEIMLKGVEWRWRKAKGFDYTEEFNSYERMVADASARDGTKRTASLADRAAASERRMAVPPGSWPL
jgi:hypothetical protein